MDLVMVHTTYYMFQVGVCQYSMVGTSRNSKLPSRFFLIFSSQLIKKGSMCKINALLDNKGDGLSTPTSPRMGSLSRRLNNKHHNEYQDTEKYYYQPRCASYLTTTTTLDDHEREDETPQQHRVLVNAALTRHSRYRDVLFGPKLTTAQERIMLLRPVYLWAWLWMCLVGLSLLTEDVGYTYSYWRVAVHAVIFFTVMNYVGAAHHGLHCRTRLPFGLRILSGMAPSPVAGFALLAVSLTDARTQHNKDHHGSKGVLEASHEDRDAQWSHLPFWHMYLMFVLQPNHTYAGEFFAATLSAWKHADDEKGFSGTQASSQTPKDRNPDYWPERVGTQVMYWAQLVLLYQLVGPRVFAEVLVVGHLAMSTLWFVFHGLLHSPAYYRFLIDTDPSGARQFHPAVEAWGRLVLPFVWTEIKFHDVHHAVVHALPWLYEAALLRGYRYHEITAALADLVDEGLFVYAPEDQNKRHGTAPYKRGQPLSPLATVGHVLGSRASFVGQIRASRHDDIAGTRALLHVFPDPEPTSG